MDNVLRTRQEWAMRGLVPALNSVPVGRRHLGRGKKGDRAMLFSISQCIPRVLDRPILPASQEALRQEILAGVLARHAEEETKRQLRAAKKLAKLLAKVPEEPKGLLALIFG